VGKILIQHRIQACLLLLISIVAFLPSAFLHTWFADHQDHAVVCGHSSHHHSSCVYEDSPDCGVDQTVVHAPMLLPLHQSALIAEFLAVQGGAPEKSLHDVFSGYFKSHRGPPVG
jgi:hypothetical protein